MKKLVLIRHGESVWNKENRFTGWTDVDLSNDGYAQAKRAGEILKSNGYEFDIGYTSVLTRAIKTLHIALEEMDCLWLPIYKSWRLNERFYGALQGLNKTDIASKYGAEQVHKWRRDRHEIPPAITRDDPRFPGRDRRYHDVSELPLTENLDQTLNRVLPFWNDVIVPAIQANQRAIISAHGNSLRALIQYLDKLTDTQVADLEIPMATPLVYELDEKLVKIKHYYLD